MPYFVPSETALVLGGGGAKGAYHLGAIEALESLGICAGSVYGTSVGALNAAMYAQRRMDLASELWAQLSLDDLVSPESLALAEEIETLLGQPEKLIDFLRKNGQRITLDVSPFAALLRRYVDEDVLRRSGVRFGLIAARFPSLAGVEKTLEEMAPGSVESWLLASSACYPAFPMTEIGGDRYVDGGYADNVPVGMALRQGARHVIALDIGRHQAHRQYALRPNVTYIRASHPLGGLLSFDPERSARCRAIGYNDVLRAFGVLRGHRYSFDPASVRASDRRAEAFLAQLTKWDATLYRKSDSSPLFSLLEEGMTGAADASEYFLRACELCADAAQLEPAKIYTVETLTEALRAALNFPKAEEMLSSLLGGRIGVLFAPPQPDKRLVIACLCRLLERESGLPALAMRTIASFPRELLCALTLRELL